MSFFSYQNKRRIKVALIVICVILILLPILFLFRCLSIAPHLVYTPDGVELDYTQDANQRNPQSMSIWNKDDIRIITEEPVAQTSSQADLPLQTLNGNYVTTQMLLELDNVTDALSKEGDMPDTLMLELKSIYGNFYYNSGTEGAVTSSADIQAIDSLIAQLASRKDLYLIARIASLSDTNYALAHQEFGLPLRSGALWMSKDGCYWLDPMEEDVQDYLVSIAQELAAMGFDEIVFDDFRIPSNTEIIYTSELTREEAAAQAAASIRGKLSDVPIRVSFNTSVAAIAESSDRVYLETEDGASVTALVDGVQEYVNDPAAEIVFLTPSRDTRFDGYGILRPLIEEREE